MKTHDFTLTMRVPSKLSDELHAIAKSRGMKRSKMIREMLEHLVADAKADG